MKSRRTCPEGYRYYKSSDCPVCPVCEASKKSEGLFSKLSAPACRALAHARITTLEQLSRHSEKEIMALHGMGPSSLPKLRQALEELGLTFREPG